MLKVAPKNPSHLYIPNFVEITHGVYVLGIGFQKGEVEAEDILIKHLDKPKVDELFH